MSDPPCPRRPWRPPTVVHHLVCQHQVAIEVWPPAAEIYFQDEAGVGPADTQFRFGATVFNAPTGEVRWEVQALDGGPGAGSIDATGVYTAPPKGGLPHATTELVIATAADDPLHKAFARVTLLGWGPEVPPPPRLEICPGQAHLYFVGNLSANMHNEYIDASNKMQLFRALLYHTDLAEVDWFVGAEGGPPAGGPDPWYLYKVAGSGHDGMTVRVIARLHGRPEVRDEAEVVLHNYTWPGIVPV